MNLTTYPQAIKRVDTVALSPLSKGKSKPKWPAHNRSLLQTSQHLPKLFTAARISWFLRVQITGLQPCRWWTRPCPWRRRWRASVEVNAWNEDTTTMRGSWKQERRQLGHPKHDTCLNIQPHSCLPHLMEAGQTEDRAEGACAGHRTFSFCGEFENNNKTD